MYGSEKDVRRNLFLFVADGVVFVPAMTLISISTIIPYFLERLGATALHIAIAVAMTYICNFISQPFFGSVASRTHKLHKTNGKILITQRIIFITFLLSIPLYANSYGVILWMFLIFWGVFNIFVGSYSVFYTSLLLKLLPPDKRGAIRGMGYAVGSVLGVGAAALIPKILGAFSFPYNYVVIFMLGTLILMIDGILFLFMREHEETEPRVPLGVLQYLKAMPSTIRKNAAFRAMILTCTCLAIANSLLSYYTLYAIRVFSATESHIATLSALSVITVSVGYVFFGFIIDRRGTKATSLIAACLITAAGAIALTTHMLPLLYVAWVLANLGSTCTMMTITLLLGDVCPYENLPLNVGVYSTISLACSSIMVLLLAPLLERAGFAVVFTTVFLCGLFSFLINVFALRKHLVAKEGAAAP